MWIATIADLPLCSNPTLLMKTTCSVKWLKPRERERERRGGVKEEQDVDTALKILTLFNESRLWLSETLKAQGD